MNIWDIGGQREIRPYWENYYDETDAVVYVVDSADTESEGRKDELTTSLNQVMAEARLAGVPLLVFANKQDLDIAMPADEV